MCELDDFDRFAQYDLQKQAVSRRQFGAITVGAGLATLLPLSANAAEVAEKEVQIQTPDGVCDAHFVAPVKGAHAAVLVWPDIFGLRPAFRQMGRRLAEAGYAVLTVNPFYRMQKAPTSPENANFADPATRQMLMGQMGSLNAQTHATDAKAFIAWLDAQPQVDTRRKIGTTGYCMGGPIIMRTAAAVPGRVGAAASFHGGGLATQAADSPHLLIPQMKAKFLIAVADNDDQKEPEVKDILRKGFEAAKLDAEIEVYKGAMHGWCPPGSAAYNHEAAEKAWSRLLVLFKSSLA